MSYDFRIQDMEDERNIKRVHNTLMNLEGVDDVRIDLGSGHVSIDCQIENQTAIISAIQAMGYTIGPVV